MESSFGLVPHSNRKLRQHFANSYAFGIAGGEIVIGHTPALSLSTEVLQSEGLSGCFFLQSFHAARLHLILAKYNFTEIAVITFYPKL